MDGTEWERNGRKREEWGLERFNLKLENLEVGVGALRTKTRTRMSGTKREGKGKGKGKGVPLFLSPEILSFNLSI